MGHGKIKIKAKLKLNKIYHKLFKLFVIKIYQSKNNQEPLKPRYPTNKVAL